MVLKPVKIMIGFGKNVKNNIIFRVNFGSLSTDTTEKFLTGKFRFRRRFNIESLQFCVTS